MDVESLPPSYLCKKSNYFINNAILIIVLGVIMKTVFTMILSIILIGYYLTAKASHFSSKKDMQVNTYSDIYFKLETSSVNINEIIAGATDFALTMCADKAYQEALGNTVASCNSQFEESKNVCSKHIMKNAKQHYTDKATVTLLTERFINCVTAA
ncbi:hypothetical protein LCGC14_0558470 [marine sediment metagenome]|uniref:Uncharacterized protein n=2 Tax=root TaxID=1 RepID=A0A0F9U996_9ZZZZ